MKKSDLVLGLVIILLCGLAFGATLSWPASSSVVGARGLDPSFFPRVVIIMLLLLALLLIWGSRKSTSEEKGFTLPSIRPFLVVLTTAGYIAFVKQAGFLITNALMLFVVTVIMGVKSSRALVFSVIGTLVVYVLFRKILMVPLPMGNW